MKAKKANSKSLNRQQWILLAAGLVALIGTWIMYLAKQAEVDYLAQNNFELQTRIVTLESKNSPMKVGSYKSSKGVSMQVFTPTMDSTVKSPLQIAGKVPGTWSFEASFPIELVDDKGKVLAKTTGNLAGNWMTDDQVVFTATISWDGSYNGPAKLVLKNDNPSGLLDKNDSVEIPLKI